MSALAFSSAVLALYAVVGFICAVAARLHAARTGRKDWGELAFAFSLWPLWLPLWLAAKKPTSAETRPAPRQAAHPATASLVAAIGRLQGSPLAPLLPDASSIQRLATKLAEASARIEELDDVLAQPTFDLPAALARQREVTAQGASASAEARTSAALRVQNIERLRELRTRFVAEVEEIDELLSQLVIQVEVVRFVGVAEDGTRDLLRELLDRVEGLGQMLDDRATLRLTGV